MLKRAKGFTLIELLIVVAIIAILAAIAVPNFLEAQTRAKVSRAKADMRSLATAMESYFVDHLGYPHQSHSRVEDGFYGVNYMSNLPGMHPLKYMPTFTSMIPGSPMHTLTTPVSYVSSIFEDPFSPQNGGKYCYSRNRKTVNMKDSMDQSGTGSNMNAGFVIWSFGPDNDGGSAMSQFPDSPYWDDSLRGQDLLGNADELAFGGGGDLLCYKAGEDFDLTTHNVIPTMPTWITESMYRPLGMWPATSTSGSFANGFPGMTDRDTIGRGVTDQMNELTYDPTNGTTSNGDVWRVKD